MKLDWPVSSWHNTNIGTVCGNQLRMSTPYRNQSLAMGDEDYFVWCERVKRCQQENEWRMQTLLRQMEWLRETNEKLWVPMSIVGPFQSQHTQSRQTALRRSVEASFLEGTKLSSDGSLRRSKKKSSPARQMQLDEGTSSTWPSRKMRHNRGLHLF